MMGATFVACNALGRQLAFFLPYKDIYNNIIKEILEATLEASSNVSEGSSDGSNDPRHVVEVF